MMLLKPKNADFYYCNSEQGALLFLLNRSELADYSHVLRIAAPVTEGRAAALINTGTALQVMPNTVEPFSCAEKLEMPKDKAHESA